jgi:TPP-dependent pyruvate/acetoin dehydrogenase alpha subunit
MVAALQTDSHELRRVVDDDGKPLPGARVPEIPDATLQRIFDQMMLVRIIDDRMSELQRDGRLGFYLAAQGEEATHFAVAPLRASDWVFPSHREHGAWFWRGYTLAQYIDQLFGNAGDPIKGRQMPVHHSAAWLNLVSISAPVGTQIPQAVGAAHAARARGKDDVALAYFGEGATSTGEFHVGLNFAGVWKAPVIFVCRNHGAKTIASKAVGYGLPGIRVDGSDVLAIWQVTEAAAGRARAGDGPTLIEALTWSEKRDPIHRLRGYLRHRDLWTAAWEQELTERYNQDITDALAAADGKAAPPVESIFDDVFEELPWHLREQRRYLAEQVRTKNPHHHG